MTKLSVLISFVGDKRGLFIKKLHGLCSSNGMELDLYIDSGAYTAMTSGSSISIEEYMAFLESNREYATWYANLDEIGDSRKTQENQRTLEARGFSPVPVFHQGSNIELFREMITTYNGKIALGGIAGRPKWMFPLFLQTCANALVTTQGKLDNHIHMFGVSPTPELCNIYPWGSFDSSTGYGFRWNRIISPLGKSFKISELNEYKARNIFLKGIQEQLHFSENTLSILREAKKPTRGYNAGIFWDAIGILCHVGFFQKLLDDVGSTATYYTAMGPLKSPFVDLFISGVKDIYEHRANSCQPD